MHIHNQPVNLYATNIHSPATVAAQQAAEIRRRLARAASSLSEESDPFESSMVGQAPDEVAASGVAIVPAARRRFMRRKKSRPEPSPFMPEPQEQIERMPSSPSPAIGTPSCRRSAARSFSRMARMHARPARRVKPFILSH